ncbi:hypothetical protein K501DRAFT_266103 [Backusella circina FSU 941]|nr:hypothetical protein K501DRAFT_266103 [Backusella circina FSU 941]
MSDSARSTGIFGGNNDNVRCLNTSNREDETDVAELDDDGTYVVAVILIFYDLPIKFNTFMIQTLSSCLINMEGYTIEYHKITVRLWQLSVLCNRGIVCYTQEFFDPEKKSELLSFLASKGLHGFHVFIRCQSGLIPDLFHLNAVGITRGFMGVIIEKEVFFQCCYTPHKHCKVEQRLFRVAARLYID